ncbi:CDP-glucose 4,6-dehydratase [Paenibacillus sp. N1-5-1-14]|uniref:CDP-glucose 4,6-dehydratase n=1 Tax=Paenibacillus radicibacter TaxID=2972488 RepID=UPI0021599118|nr:CDP-glucose 4,6-dehydratase [Paenibacillus radicibacter]MCR8643446.1 CDP-glucose 4,6-dehydratase [Paenibacillus radicibacter]
MIDQSFWQGKRVMITGHTGFKGTWLTIWLSSLGAEVIGYSDAAPSKPSMFEVTCASALCTPIQGDLLQYERLLNTMQKYQPEIVFHLAAQPIVQTSYQDPIGTYRANVLGTVHVLEAVRYTPSVRIIVNVTSDKCYANDGLGSYAFSEQDRLGGHDPYSASKACTEIVTTSYQQSFFNGQKGNDQRLASVRAGNVIGGGDWAEGRLVPDIVRSYEQGSPLIIRNPKAIRPWQHVLDPLHGYVGLAEKLWEDASYAEAWNFGPMQEPTHTVHHVIERMMTLWGEKLTIVTDSVQAPYEAPILRLDSSKAVSKLDWYPKLSTQEALEWTVQWYQHYAAGGQMLTFTLTQIHTFMTKVRGAHGNVT